MNNEAFDTAFQQLNKEQRRAVEQIDGPVLVIAGPGTGKTQLLGMRVAQILRATDTPAQNVLCLTFTESGAANMRERLSRFIGQTAYDVTIGTYHSFGGELIRRFPQYFTETRLQSAVDDLGRRQILSDIVGNMSYANPLKQTQQHLGDLMSTISEVKRALLDADSLRNIAKENLLFVNRGSQALHIAFDGIASLQMGIKKALPLYEGLLEQLQPLTPSTPVNQQFGSLASAAVVSLQEAIQVAETSNKTTPLTAWKNAWLAKNADNQFVMGGDLENRRLQALADVFEAYQAALEARGLYDFDDMIIRTIRALEQHDELKYTLQEQYLYVLLDEFQDTNAAQLRLIELLSDNSVNEGRPNVMAVGDDDQAIYAFQGAQYSNMLDFHGMYRDVTVVNLVENYRSAPAILETAENIASQIGSRLSMRFEDMSKQLTSSNSSLPAPAIERQEFQSDIAQADHIAQQVRRLIDNGTHPEQIAIIAPKHKYLEPLVPYLNNMHIPVHYEKRENILDAPVIRQLLSMSRLVLALRDGAEATANALWPQVLSYDFWQIPTSVIWKLSWQINKTKDTSWSMTLLESDEPLLRNPTLLFMTLAHKTDDETCETILDYLIGTTHVETHETDTPTVTSPLRNFYASPEQMAQDPLLFYETLSHLKVLRTKLRDYQQNNAAALTLRDLLTLVALYEEAEERMLNTSPYTQNANAVKLMTVYKAKGLEFEHVFLPFTQDDVWGSSARANSNKLTLPANLQPIRHGGANEDERLRLFFVAITRAKFGLHMSNTANTYSGKTTKRLKYLDEQTQPDNTSVAMALPEPHRLVHTNDHTAPPQKLLELDWHSRHVSSLLTQPTMQNLLRDRLKTYQLSPTHVNSFTDLEYSGPLKFFFSTILRFPEAPTVHSQFGNAIHETLEWYLHQLNATGDTPAWAKTKAYFRTCLENKRLTEAQFKLELERGEKALQVYLAQRGSAFRAGDKAEMNFHNEGVFVGPVHMGGKIDRLEIDTKAKTIVVVDYKTGKAYDRWASDTRLHKYKRQLYCYKLLIEGSHTFADYTVSSGRLEFIEPDGNGRIQTLPLDFDDKELEETKKLLIAVWQHIQSLNFPNITDYPATLTGAKQFESDLTKPSPGTN